MGCGGAIVTAPSVCRSTVAGVEHPIRVRLLGRSVLVSLRVNEREAGRREAAGTGALTDISLLQVLATLPAWEFFTWSSLSRREQRILRSAPPGVLERAGSRARRLAVPAANVDSVVVEARSGTAGLAAASAFAPYCRRNTVIPAAAANDETTLLNAQLYGIGIVVRRDGQYLQVAEAAPFVLRRWSWASWLFHEQAWAQAYPVRTDSQA